MTLLELLEKVRQELPECELTSIVSLQSGLSLAAVGPGDLIEAATVDAFSGEVYRLLASAIGDEPQDVVFRGPERVFVSIVLSDTGYFWHMSTTAGITLGFTQAVMRKYQRDVTQAVGDLVRSDRPS